MVTAEMPEVIRKVQEKLNGRWFESYKTKRIFI
jgi:hypothetical protein